MTSYSNLPFSGSLDMNSINSVFGRGNDLGSYRGTTRSISGQLNSWGAFPVSNIKFSSFYGTTPGYTFPYFYQIYSGYQNGWGGFESCAGAGYDNLYFTIDSYQGILVHADTWYADYNSGTGGNYVIASKGTLFDPDGYPIDGANGYSGVVFSSGRDSLSFKCYMHWDGATCTVQIYGSCKDFNEPAGVSPREFLNQSINYTIANGNY